MTVLTRAAQWMIAAWRWRRQAARDWHSGVDLLRPLPPAAADLAEPCPVCSARHCAGCTEPARVTSTATRHIARHCMDEVPPSLRWMAEQVHVTFRATLITAELVGRHVTKPADPVAFGLWARAKLGRPLQLGTVRKLVLP